MVEEWIKALEPNLIYFVFEPIIPIFHHSNIP